MEFTLAVVGLMALDINCSSSALGRNYHGYFTIRLAIINSCTLIGGRGGGGDWNKLPSYAANTGTDHYQELDTTPT
jgi:hypothetical protein